MKKITVVTEASTQSFKADLFDVDENGYLTLRSDDAVVARFSPAAWHGVYDEEAVA
jgi:hypothetical protein